MGDESLCRVQIGAEFADAKALLETEELIVRGALRAKIPFRNMTDVRAAGGVLSFRWNERDVKIHLGDEAPIKVGQKITVLGTIDESSLDGKGADVSKRLR